MSIIAHLHFSGSNVSVFFYVFMIQDWLGNLLFAYSIFSILSIIQMYFSPKSVGKPVKSRSMLLYQVAKLVKWRSMGYRTRLAVTDILAWNTDVLQKLLSLVKRRSMGYRTRLTVPVALYFPSFFIFIFLSLLLFFLLLVYSDTRYDLVESSCRVPLH